VRSGLLLALSVRVLFPAALSAQEVVEIPDAPLCPTCEIVLDSVVVLDGRRGDYVGEPLALGRLRDGRWLLSTLHAPERIAVFDPTGRIRRTVGREGEGPGEYRFIRFIRVGPDDTVRVYDADLGRLSILSPTLEFVRSQYMSAASRSLDLEILPDGRLLTVQDLRGSPERVGFPLHLIGRDGTFLR